MSRHANSSDHGQPLHSLLRHPFRGDATRLLRQRGDLPAEDVLRLVRLALGERLPDARDDTQTGGERGLRAARDTLVGLAEELPTLRVTDDCVTTTKLGQHARRHFAGERARRVLAHILRPPRDRRRREHDILTDRRIVRIA